MSKSIHQARILRIMGWEHPPAWPGVRGPDWVHLLDAVGMALVAADDRRWAELMSLDEPKTNKGRKK